MGLRSFRSPLLVQWQCMSARRRSTSTRRERVLSYEPVTCTFVDEELATESSMIWDLSCFFCHCFGPCLVWHNWHRPVMPLSAMPNHATSFKTVSMLVFCFVLLRY